MKLRGGQSILTFIIIALILFSTLHSDVDTNNNKQSLKNEKIVGKGVKDTHRIYLNAVNSTFIGYYVRGEDYCKIDFTLIDSETGEPISNALIEVYLNSSEGDIYLGENYTDENGRFVFVFLVESHFPIGEVNITAIFEGDPIQGYGEARAYYWAFFYGRVFVGVRPSGTSKPLFDDNISILVWAYLDNGEIVERESLNFTVRVHHVESSTTFEYNVTSDSTGVGNLFFNYSTTGVGNYSVTAIINGTNNVLQPFILFANQDVDEEGNIIGEPYSMSISSFEVLLASKIDASFEALNPKRIILDAYLNESITVVGIYYDANGSPARSEIIATISQGRNIIAVLETESNDTGFFQITINPLSLILNVGSYRITFRDKNESTQDISQTLQLNLYSIIKIDVIFEYENPLFMVGDTLAIRGRIYDGITGENASGISVHIKLVSEEYDYSLGSTTSDENGEFYFMNITIPLLATGPNATLLIFPEITNPFYEVSEWRSVISLFTTVNVTLVLNESDVFTWLITQDAITYSSGDSFILSSKRNITLKMLPIKDEFGRFVPKSVSIYMDNMLMYFGLVNDTILFDIYINETTNITITIDSLPTITLSIILRSPNLGTQGIVPPTISLVFFVLIFGALLLYRFRDKLRLPISFKVETVDIQSRIEEIKVLLRHKRFGEVAIKINELLKHIASNLKINLKESLTAREILNLIYPMIEKDIYKVLEKLVIVYETIRYGKKEPEYSVIESLLKELPLLRHIEPSPYLGELE